MAAIQEFGKDPKGAMAKYGQNPEFREIMMEFSKLMGGHFEGIADKKQQEEKEQLENDPVYQTI